MEFSEFEKSDKFCSPVKKLEMIENKCIESLCKLYREHEGYILINISQEETTKEVLDLTYKLEATNRRISELVKTFFQDSRKKIKCGDKCILNNIGERGRARCYEPWYVLLHGFRCGICKEELKLLT